MNSYSPATPEMDYFPGQPFRNLDPERSVCTPSYVSVPGAAKPQRAAVWAVGLCVLAVSWGLVAGGGTLDW